MKYQYLYERSQSAGKLEAVLLVASALGALAGVWILLRGDWTPAIAVFLLSLLAFALSRLLALLADLFSCVARLEPHQGGDQKRNSEPES